VGGKPEPNLLLRAARLAKRETQAQTAASLCEIAHRPVDPEYIGRLERGVVTWPNAQYRAALIKHFDVTSPGELGLYCRRSKAAPTTAENDVDQGGSSELDGLTPQSAPSWDVRAVVDRAARIAEDDLMPPTRRTLLAGAATLSGAILATELEPLLRPVAWYVRRRSSAFTGAELAAAERLTTSLRGRQLQSGALARSAVVAQLNAHLRRLRAAPQDTPQTRRAFRVGAELAEIAASMSWDVGEHVTAQRYFVLSIQLAHAARDSVLAAVAMASLARQCFDLGRPDDGLDVVQLAQYTTRRTATPRLRAMLATREAWAYAHQGDTRAFRRAAGLAEDYHSEGEREGETHTHAIRSLDAAELAGVLGARYRDLSRVDPQHARTGQDYIQSALTLRHPSNTRNRVFDLIGLARAHLVTREPDRAAELVGEAIPLARGWVTGRVGAKLRDFHREAAPFATVRAVRESREAVAALTGTV
jgi:hypothetical protein